MKKVLLAACALCLTGCYTVDNERFSAHVTSLLQANMTIEAAEKVLVADGFSCDSATPSPSRTCSKTRQRLLPSTCIERVNLYPSDANAAVARIDVRPIICAGL